MSEWYPNAPDTSGKATVDAAFYASKVYEKQQARISVPPHKIWSGGSVKYTSNNFWSPKISKDKKEKCRRQIVVGVEVKDQTGRISPMQTNLVRLKESDLQVDL